ncbi:right-handed parallel beta-helix repeat-containing protein [Gallaecimonas sp. GXIMD4217]|uniref:right-handed parallel beta-helix repeat-containing protein n=1 Tax=Gallaecimonas sp. GXIMD4217 TaxID=3131927 RepID=UPI00311B3D7F
MNQANLTLPGLLALATVLTGCTQTSTPPQPQAATDWRLGTPARILQVTSLADAGAGSLRAAITLANDSPGTDLIVFRSDKGLFAKPQTIELESPLPAITDELLIDGYIDNMLWKASGITLDGNNRHGIFRVSEGVKAKISHLTLANGQAGTGGAVFNAGTLILSGMLLRDNQAREGGALYNQGQLQLINSTFFNNQAKQQGGAVANLGHMVITHNTFHHNGAPNGGAISNSGSFVLRNSIVANSRSDFDCLSSTLPRQGSTRNLIESSSGCGAVFSSQDPKLGKLGGYNGPTRTIPISTRSPAFNWADNSAAVDELARPLVWDQRGNGDPRYAGGIADIGAFEVQSRVIYEVDTLSDEDIRQCTRAKGDCSLRGVLALLGGNGNHGTVTFDKQLFSEPRLIRLASPLPRLNKQLVLDASNTAGVTIRLDGDAAAFRNRITAQQVVLLGR